MVDEEDNQDVRIKTETEKALHLLLWGLLFTVPLFFLMMILPPAGVDEVEYDILPGNGSLPIKALVGLILSTPVQFGVGYGFYVRAFKVSVLNYEKKKNRMFVLLFQLKYIYIQSLHVYIII